MTSLELGKLFAHPVKIKAKSQKVSKKTASKKVGYNIDKLIADN